MNSPSKECFKCGEGKPLSEFYKHKRMSDGHLNKCKDCTKKDASANRWANIERVREYDRSRPRTRISPTYKPAAVAAQRAVNNAIRDGKLRRVEQCEVCGTTGKLAGHHDDYAMPLEVRWLCYPCHADWHKHNGEALNAF